MSIAEALMALAKDSKDERAWSVVHNHYWSYLVPVARRYVGPNTDATKDAVSETFWRFYLHGKFEPPWTEANLKPYLATICRNVCNDMRSRAARRREVERPLETENDSHYGSRGEASVEHLPAEELYDAVLNMLDGIDRTIFVMRVEGYSLGEIAERLRLSYRATATRWSRIKARIRGFLDVSEEGEGS